jgi:hypothetical protein
MVFFTFIHNCVWIFWFNARNAKKFIKSQNEFQWTCKHAFWQDYFLHMWLVEHQTWVIGLKAKEKCVKKQVAKLRITS